jgi:predicted dinucleotide-binding enzyme
MDFSRGMPPTLTVANTDSLGESIQRAYPETRVVKALNTINCLVMVDPGRVPGEHDVFVCGNDEDAKARRRRCSRASSGGRSTSSTWTTSPPPARPRCT